MATPTSPSSSSPRTTRRSARPSVPWRRTRSPPTRRPSTRSRATRRRRTTPSSPRTSSPRTSPRSTAASGADALATCIVIEEVARVDASASLIPAVNKLGTMPLDPRRVRGRQARYLRPVAEGRSTFSYGLSEREAGSDTAAMRTQGAARRRRLGAQRPEVVDHQRRGLRLLHRPGRHRPRRPARQQRLGLRRGEVRRGLHVRREGAQARHQGQPHPRAATSTTCASPATGSSARWARGSRSPCAPSTTPA